MDFSNSNSDIGNGNNNYLAAIEIGDVIIFDPSVSDLKKDNWSGRVVIEGSFWTEWLAERWFAKEERKKIYELKYTGFVGFEPNDREDLSRIHSLIDDDSDVSEIYVSVRPGLDLPELKVQSKFISGYTENPRICSTEIGNWEDVGN